MIVFDTSFLALAFDKDAAIPLDPSTNLPVTKCKERIDHLIMELNKAKQRVLIPTPVLAEYLVNGGLDKDIRLQEFTNSRVFLVCAFDLRAAIECAMIEDGDSKSGKKFNQIESKAKVKFDRQIIAVAIARGAETIYTGDNGLADRARQNNLNVVMTWEIKLPPEPPQLELKI